MCNSQAKEERKKRKNKKHLVKNKARKRRKTNKNRWDKRKSQSDGSWKPKQIFNFVKGKKTSPVIRQIDKLDAQLT